MADHVDWLRGGTGGGGLDEDGDAVVGQLAAERPPVDAAEYDEAYFLCASEGYREFAASRGRRLGARLRKVLELADVRPGQRVLDVGCGRGELVVQCALRGARAAGIDYAEAAVRIANEAIGHHPAAVRDRCQVLAMDACRLRFEDASFDTAVMSDVVEHLTPSQLDAALAEVRRVLRPGGRLVIHTYPNRELLDVTYPAYVRRVHQVMAAACRLLRYRDSIIRPDVPTGPIFPRSEHERRFHVNEQSGASLRLALHRRGFEAVRMRFWQPAAYAVGWPLRLWALDLVRYLRPFSFFPPLNRYFCGHIWAVARRP